MSGLVIKSTRVSGRVWLSLGLLGALVVVFEAVRWANNMHTSLEGIDLRPPMQAARTILAGHGSIYTNMMFTYLPTSAVFFVPVAHAGRGFLNVASYLDITAVLASAYVASWAVIRRPWWLVAAAALTIFVLKSKIAISSGFLENLNMILGLVGVSALLLMNAGRWREACVVLGVSILFKPVLAPLLLVPILKGAWKPALLTVAGVATLTVFVAAVTPGGWHVFGLPHDLSRVSVELGRIGQNLTLAYIAHRHGVPTGVVLALRVAIGAAVVWACIAGSRSSDALMLGYAVLLGTMVAGSYFEVSYCFLLVPVPVLVWMLRGQRIAALGLLCGCLLLFEPLIISGQGRSRIGIWLLGACVMLGSLVLAIVRSRSHVEPTIALAYSAP